MINVFTDAMFGEEIKNVFSVLIWGGDIVWQSGHGDNSLWVLVVIPSDLSIIAARSDT